MTRIRRGLVGPGCLPTRLDRKIADDVAFLVWDYGSYLYSVVLMVGSGMAA
jgi:hypothetical protein